MPLYEYQCDSCGERFEAIQKFADTPLTLHEKCGGPARRLLSVPALQFKGSGFYINDYAKSGSTSGNGESKSESKNESKKKNESGDSSSGKEASGAKTESTASSTKSSDTPAPSTTSKPVSDKK